MVTGMVEFGLAPAGMGGFLEVIDGVLKFTHLAAIAVGVGGVVSTDVMTFRRAQRPVTDEYLASIESAHALIMPALVAAWITGLLLLVTRYGVNPAEWSGKAWAKLVVVSLLSVTAMLVKRQVAPVLMRLQGRTLIEAPLADKLIMAVCAALSITGWTLALAIGAISSLKALPAWVVLLAVVAAYGTALALAIRAARSMDRNLELARRQADRIKVSRLREARATRAF